MTEIKWVDPVPGFRYEPDHQVVSTQLQAEKLTVCGLPPEVFGAELDPSFLIGIGIRAGVSSGISAEGGVNMVQSLIQHRPGLLDEPFVVQGEIKTVEEVPRGWAVFADVWCEDASGKRMVSAPRLSLRPDPARSGAKGAGARPADVLTDPGSLPVLSSHQLTPEIVCAYSSDGNSIHYDEESAKRAGFRAPIIGGGMGVHYLMAALWRAGRPEQFDASIYFRRPIFWDDAFDVVCDGDPAVPAQWRGIGLVKAGKVLTEMSLC